MMWYCRGLLHHRAEGPEAASCDAQHKPVLGHRRERGGPGGPVGLARRHATEVAAQQRDGKLAECVTLYYGALAYSIRAISEFDICSPYAFQHQISRFLSGYSFNFTPGRSQV